MVMIQSLEQLGASGSLVIGNVRWNVAGKEIYQDNAVEKDIQWTIESDGNAKTHYLILSQSKEGQEKLREVLVTCPAEIDSVEYQTKDGIWTAFKETGTLAAPPATIRHGQEIFDLDDQTSDRAVDNDGNNVERLTWDYYNRSRGKNLAIEIWKESDADYYEVYLGDLIDERYIRFLSEAATLTGGARKTAISWGSIRSRVRKMSFKNLLISVSIVFFAIPLIFAAITGCPMDSTISFYVPFIAFISFLIICDGNLTSLLKAMPMALAIIPLMIIKSPAYYYAAAFFACGYILNRLFYSSDMNLKGGVKVIASSTAAFLGLWLASFIHYFRYAPAPHTGGELLVTCAIPVIGAAICSAAFYLVEKA